MNPRKILLKNPQIILGKISGIEEGISFRGPLGGIFQRISGRFPEGIVGGVSKKNSWKINPSYIFGGVD